MMPEHLIPKCIRTQVKRKSSFNSREREAIRLFLIIRDGEICNICKGPAGENETFDIDHIDGEKTNPFHENLQLAHHACNAQKNVKGWKKGVDLLCVCVDGEDLPPAGSAELATKLIYYPAFIKYLIRKFTKENVSAIDISDMAKNLFVSTGGSSETFKRYANDLCGTEGPGKIHTDKHTKKKYLMLKYGQDIEKLYRKKYYED